MHYALFMAHPLLASCYLSAFWEGLQEKVSLTQQILVSLNEGMREKEKLEKNVYIKEKKKKKKKEESDGQPWVIGVAQLDLQRTQWMP